MRAEDNRLLCTIDEFARYLGYQLEYNDFGKYSFATINEEDTRGKALSSLVEKTSGWYGIRAVTLPFYSLDTTIAIGYWGGGGVKVFELPNSNKAGVYYNDFKANIINSLEYTESTDGDTLLLVEIDGIKA